MRGGVRPPPGGPLEDAESSVTDPTHPWRVRAFLRPVRGLLVLVLMLMVIGVALGLAQPIFVRYLIDAVILEAREDRLWLFGAAFLGAGLVRFGLGIIQARAYAGLTARVLLDLRLDFLAHLQTLDLRFFARTRFGDIVTRFNRDLSQLQEIATGALLGFVMAVLTLTGAITISLLIAPDLFLLAAAPFPIAILLTACFRPRVRRLTERLREHSQEMASTVTESIIGMRTVRVFGREKGEQVRFLGVGHRLFREVLGFQVTHAVASGLPRLCLLASSIVLYWVGGIRVIRGELGLGDLVALGLYLTIAFGPLGSLVELWLQVIGARVSLGRIREMRCLSPAGGSPPDPIAPGPLEGAVELVDLHFSHGDVPLLRGLQGTIPPGEKVAILGRSGVGKSTLVDLLLGFLEPDRGKILFDGKELATLTRERVREQCGVVLAETFLFHGTVAENIRFGDPLATSEEIAQAATLAGLPSQDLTATLARVVGERGAQLSAGEKQRIGLARALVRTPKILFLDEATSDLDPATEREILERLSALPQEPTIIAVTHRGAVADWADRTWTIGEDLRS